MSAADGASDLRRTPLPAAAAERTVPDVLDARATAFPGRVALIAHSLVTGGEVRLTYGELREAAIRLAGVLADAGVGKGDRVAIMCDNDGAVEAHVAYHASHRLGAINVPVNTRYVPRELAYALEFVAPAAIVFGGRFAERLGGLRDVLGNALLLEVADAPVLGRSYAAAMAGARGGHVSAPVDEHDDADWIFTSGTTGNPKAVALTHGQSVACGHQAVPSWGLDGTSVHQSFAPFFTSTGCHTNLLSCLVAGCTYAVEPGFDVHETLKRMRRYGTTSTFLINTVLQLIFDRVGEDALAEGDFPALRRICYGGQPGSPEFARRLYAVGQRMGIELVNIYGLTESGNAGLMLRWEDHPAALERIGPYGLSIGRTPFHPWVEYAVLDQQGDAVPAGEVGELCMRGPSTMSRYVRDPEATAEALRNGWLYTGDMCSADADGFVSFVDRRKQLIRRGGLNISSAEVEGVLLGHPGVAEVAAVPLPNPVLGEDVRAVVVAVGDPPPTEAELVAYCRERLADYKVPARIDFVAALPRNGMGRVIKGVLTGKGGSLDGPDPDA